MLKFKDNTKSQTHTHTHTRVGLYCLVGFKFSVNSRENRMFFLSLIFFALITILNEMWRLLVQMEHIDDAADHLTVCKLLTGFQ